MLLLYLAHLHPSCSATVTTNCLPPPFDGDLLQIMPWPIYHHMTDHDLRAIYEYLRAIPCVAGPDAPSPLHNDCDDNWADANIDPASPMP